MQKYCSIKMKMLLFGTIFLVFALMVSSTSAAAGGEPIKDIDISLEQIHGKVTAAGPGIGEPVKEKDISLEDTSTDEIFDWDNFFAELKALYEEHLAKNTIATKAEKKSSAPIRIDEIEIAVEKVERHGILTDSKHALDAFVGSTTKSLKKGERVALVGFGSFSVKKRSARTERDSQGRTVGAGQVIDIIE